MFSRGHLHSMDVLCDLSDTPHRRKAAKNCTLLPFSCHPLVDNTYCNLDRDCLMESWRRGACGQWWCVFLCVLYVSEMVRRVAQFRWTHRLSIYAAFRHWLFGDLDTQYHYTSGQFSLCFFWQAAEFLHFQREPVDGSPAVLVSFVHAPHKSHFNIGWSISSLTHEFPWWHMRCNTLGFPLLSIDYVNLQ